LFGEQMSLIGMAGLAVDGLLQRRSIILHPLTVPAGTQNTRGPYPRKPYPKPAVRPISGSSQTDEFADQRFRSEPRRAAPAPTPVKTFGGFSAQNPTSSRRHPVFSTGVQTGDFGALPARAPVKTFDQGLAEIARTPIKTF
jgi:hypothetical protein